MPAVIVTGSDSGIGKAAAVALELAGHAITVNAVAPGEIATPMTHQEDEDLSTVDRPAIPLASFVIDGGMLLMAAEANAVVQS